MINDLARQTIEGILRAAQVPGAVLALARGDATPELLAIGVDGTGRPLAADSLFPVASVTKLATALAVLRLVEAGALGLDDPLSAHMPDADSAAEGVTMRTLLCHSSGLPLDVAAEAAPYASGLDWPALKGACRTTPLEAPPNTRVQYSNVGYGLLGAIVGGQRGQPFVAALRELVLAPLGVDGYLGEEPPRPPATLAQVRGEHAGTPLEPFNSPFWRSLALPWAGLVTDAAGAMALARAFAGTPAGFLASATLAAATSSQTGDLAGGFVAPLRWKPCPWGLGPEVRGHKSPHWTGNAVSARSFGHSGASGSLAWADPERDLALVLLGARPADSGWLLRRGPAIVQALLDSQGKR